MRIFLSVFLGVFAASLSSANERLRPESPFELGKAAPDPLVRVNGARVAWADYAALKRDFPALRAMSDQAIDQWVLDNFAFVSEEQLKLNGIRQTPIPVEPSQSKVGYRPTGWGRAAVLPLSKGSGMVDVKGIGHAKDASKLRAQLTKFEQAKLDPAKLNALRIQDHNDGLMSLGEAIAEVTRQQAAQRLFDIHNVAHGARLETIESYFIVEFPFRILKKDGESISAGLYGRQAHVGRGNGLPVPKDIYVDPQGMFQQDRFGAAVDFGGVMIREPSLERNYGGQGFSMDPQGSRPWVYGHETAESVSRDPQAIGRHLQEMVAPIEKKWRETANARASNREPDSLGELLNQVRKRSFKEPQWYVRLDKMLETASSEAQDFVAHLMSLEKKSAQDQMLLMISSQSAPPRARRGAIRLLSMSLEVGEIPGSPKAQERLARIFEKSTPQARALLSPFLPSRLLGHAKAHLAAAARGKDSVLKLAAARKLAELDRPDELKSLAEALSMEPIQKRRSSIVTALKREPNPDRSVTEALARAALRDRSASIRARILERISLAKPDAAWKKFFVEVFKNETSQTNRQFAANSLAETYPRDRAVQLLLLSGIEEEGLDSLARNNLFSSLAKTEIRDPEVKKRIAQLARHPNPEVTELAKQLLPQKCVSGVAELFK